MKITQIIDKNGSAIHKLALAIQEHNPHLNIQICDVHPKRPSELQMRRALDNIKDSDIVHVQYWRSGKVLMDAMRNKRKILSHHNPYDLRKERWDEYKRIVVFNETQQAILPRAQLIPHSIDLHRFIYKIDYVDKNNKKVLMVAARIESSKGILEVANACKGLKYDFHLVGRVSDGGYCEKVKKTGATFHEDITEQELIEHYQTSAITVVNSKDNFESGPLIVLEAMATGCPVITRSVGLVPDIYDGSNLYINENAKDDIGGLTAKLKELMDNYNLRLKLREKAWQTVKNRDNRRFAWKYCKLYYDVHGGDWVSVIVPTFDRPKVLLECLRAIDKQTYKNIEIIVSDSGNVPAKDLVMGFRSQTKRPLKYIYFENNGEYTLPKARNLALMEAQGRYVALCDERIKMSPDAILELQKMVQPRTWVYGVKDDAPKEFVENFSMIERQCLIDMGGFNERINVYGGGSQELRQRGSRNGIMFQNVLTAQARAITKSKNKWQRKQNIIEAKYKLWKLYEQ